jgi:hypothetical protein
MPAIPREGSQNFSVKEQQQIIMNRALACPKPEYDRYIKF